MSWVRLAKPTACSFCQSRIDAGVPVRCAAVESLRNFRWCVPCAKARLLEEPPADVPDALAASVPAAPAPTGSFRSFDRGEVGGQLRANILNWRRDGRMAAAGKQD